MAYSAYDVAMQILQVRNYTELHVSGFVELPKDVLSALLWLTAEYRNVDEMEELIKMGADPHETHDDFTVLEVFVQGHDGGYRGQEHTSAVEAGVKMLAGFGVGRDELKHSWILSNCETVLGSRYLVEFFQTAPQVKVHYHLPRAEKLQTFGTPFRDVERAVKALHWINDYKQYVAVIEDRGKVTRWLFTRGAGELERIPMENPPGWSKQQEMVSNIVNFVMARDEFPTLPCEEEC